MLHVFGSADIENSYLVAVARFAMLPWFRNPSILILCSLLQSSISHSALSEDLALVVAGGDGQGLEVEVRVLFVERFKHFDFHRQFLLKKKVWTPTMNCALPDLPSMVE